ncbi:MAG: NifB/NifX family molybdenum-iron cluster-binding protein [Desulfobulbus sp.]|jgi:predicted Fe-Mo cluster-binding NifX family protein|nr:NifB/NifX family molybdenum-iron cluster-binding protein [Desulfobulbus sp.]
MKRKGAPVNIAVTVWGQRVSPVFDSARTLLIAEIAHGALVTTSRLAFDPGHPGELMRMLRARKVMIIICGAVSEEPAAILEAAGFELISFITGDVQRVLEAFVLGRTFGGELCMPGCSGTFCCHGRIRRGQEIGGACRRPAGRFGGKKQSLGSDTADLARDQSVSAGGQGPNTTSRADEQ